MMVSIKSKILIEILCFVVIFSSCTFFEDNSLQITGDKIVESSQDISDDIDYIKNPIDVREIKQWSLSNQGIYPSYSNNGMAWEFDERKACKGCDINYSDFSLYSKRECTVAVIDTSVNVLHTDYQNIWHNANEIIDDNIDNDNNEFVDDYFSWNFVADNNAVCDDSGSDYSIHGNLMVGVLCAHKDNFTGIFNNTKCNVMCIQAIDGRKLKGDVDDVIKAIEYAQDNGAKICCMAFSTYVYSEELENAIRSSDMLFVVPSGNDGFELDENLKVYPACFDYDNCISVADMRCDGNLSIMSNYSSDYIDVAAPGTDIISTYPDGTYGVESGTSLASAYVTGLAGMVYSCSSKELSANQIKRIIINNATVNDILKDRVKSSGYIDYTKSLLNVIDE